MTNYFSTQNYNIYNKHWRYFICILWKFLVYFLTETFHETRLTILFEN